MYNSYLKNLTDDEIRKIVSRKITICLLLLCLSIGWWGWVIQNPKYHWNGYLEMVQNFWPVFSGKHCAVALKYDYKTDSMFLFTVRSIFTGTPYVRYVWDVLKWVFCVIFPWATLYWIALYIKSLFIVFYKRCTKNSISMNIRMWNGEKQEFRYALGGIERELIAFRVAGDLGMLLVWTFAAGLVIPAVFPDLGMQIIYGSKDPFTETAYQNVQAYGMGMGLVWIIICMIRPLMGLLIGAGALVMTYKGASKGAGNA